MDGQGRNVVSSFIIYVPGITTCVLVLYRRTTSRSSSTVQCTVGPISLVQCNVCVSLSVRLGLFLFAGATWSVWTRVSRGLGI
jgi:lysylphosphatidylglycerol synthetase-like protein (DUF2156 family)